ncbi:hypothetical protein GCM10010387_29270 [Streptomyces inusitatus]|uniref:Uncharacterized protein n=1 Tax=Streptomyces inusitatus TaxID=68221 RepID=A0A918Q4H7_9ACTN|nr:hypothetical protein [Streptomyces inusitatus]GGZ33281.1 hypothetical protein GCM10010387_29270 [Streptomyces inusitatus]
MAAPPPLAVPLHLDVLVANEGLLGRDDFRWWQFNYQALNHWHSPQPTAFDRSEGGPGEGVHLSWTLPDALRHAPADQPQGTYPLVPNRWLIVRMYGTTNRGAAAWVLESDCPLTPKAPAGADPGRTSQYLADPALITAWKASRDDVRKAVTLDENATTVQVARLGVPFPLDGWTERAPAQDLFLTAMAPGNPLFTGYVAHHAGVFSFHDPLNGIDNDSLSYYVIGWYSDPAHDILAPAAGDTAAYTALLGKLGWALPAGASTTPAGRSIYHAAAFHVDWHRTGPAPTADPLQAIRDSGELNVGVGDTATDAFTALVAERLGDPARARLLQAFQYELLPQLNEANGDALLDQAIRRTWYGPKPGGHSWTIVENTSHGAAGTTLTPAEQTWLTQLNQDQAALDEALTTLNSLQRKLHTLWFKKGHLSAPVNTWPTPPSGITDLTGFRARLETELDPAHSGSTAALLIAQFATVQNLLAKVPRPDPKATDPQQALRQGITAFAKTKNLDSGKTLKAVNAPRYWQGNNPVVVLSGVQPPPATTPTGTLTVRPYDTLITGVFLPGTQDAWMTGDDLLAGVGSVDALPDGAVKPLLREFLLLDPANAHSLAPHSTAGIQASLTTLMTDHHPDSYKGTLPALPLTSWQQPWTPLFLEWSGTYTHIPLTTGTTENWTFDGTDYRLTAPPPDTPEQRTVQGISPLSPHTSTLFRTRLDDFVHQYGTTSDLARIDDLINKTYEWRFLAQELTGFHEILALRDPRPFRRPTPDDRLGTLPLAPLLGYPDPATASAYTLPAAAQGQVDTAPLLPAGPALPFHGARHGGFHFTDLRLYDAFGRTLDIMESGPSSGVLDETNFPLQLDPHLTPDRAIDPAIASVIQLPPRLLQHARLDIRLLDAHDDHKVYGHDADVTPISGWILPNHLDHSILLFAPDGTALGDYRITTQSNGTRTGTWAPPPHSRLTLNDVQTAAPRLHSMITSPHLATEAGFNAFLDVIDATLWTTDPLGNRADTHLSILVGRPLALLRTRLRFQFDGDPAIDTGWATTFTPTSPDVLTQQFAIRLGDQATHQDGVIGYFTGTDYTTFNSTAAPPTAPAQHYVRVTGPIGPAGSTPGNYLRLTPKPGTHQDITVLADPRAALHAHTGILPVTRYDIPQQPVEAALAAMEITFRTGPLLTSLRPSPAQGTTPPAHPQAVTHLAPAEQNGVWSWWEPSTNGTWTAYDLTKPSTAPTGGPQASTLREGMLQITISLNTTSQTPTTGHAPEPDTPTSTPHPGAQPPTQTPGIHQPPDGTPR